MSQNAIWDLSLIHIFDCFHPNAIYVGLAKAQIKKLNDQMIEPEAAAE